MTSKNNIYVWGWNEHGNLGTGDKEDRLSPVKWDIESDGKVPKVRKYFL